MNAALRRTWLRMTADRKRFGVLCAALTVGLLLWARLIISSRVPRMAVADQPPAAAATTASPSAGAPASRTPEAVPVVLMNAPSRDPFVISPLHFPKPTSVQQTDQEDQKSPAQATEEPADLQALRDAEVLAVASGLKLEAAFGRSMAVISGSRVRAGEDLALTDQSGQRFVFKLEAINQRSVILECEGRRFELQMAAPGD